MDAEITADTAMLQDAVTHTAGCGSTSTRVAPSRQGDQVDHEERHGHHHQPQHAEHRRGDQALAEVVVGRPDGGEHDAADAEQRGAEHHGRVAVALLPDLAAELAGQQQVDQEDAEDEKDQTECAVGATRPSPLTMSFMGALSSVA